MRCFQAGFILLALASSTFAQVRGEVESIGFGSSGVNRAQVQKLLLSVTEGSSTILSTDYAGALGLSEFPNFVRLPNPRLLPQSVLAYQAVDAVLWVHGDARVLSEQGSKQLVAL